MAVAARTQKAGDSRFEGSLAETVRDVAGAGGRAIAVPTDLSKREDRERLVAETEAQLGPVDILVNNAAVTYFEPVDTFNLRHYDLMFEVQVKGPFELAQLVLPGMRARQRGWILNISSLAAVHPAGPPYARGGGGAVYGMCKAALERFTTGLASEGFQDGIAVNALSPSGLVITAGTLHHQLDKLVPEDRQEPPRLQPALDRVQTKMRGDDAQHPVIDQQIGIDRAARLVFGDGEIDRPGGKYREPGQDRIAESERLSALIRVNPLQLPSAYRLRKEATQ